jgi:hypothetical protein
VYDDCALFELLVLEGAQVRGWEGSRAAASATTPVIPLGTSLGF